MSSPFSGRAGRLASIAVGEQYRLGQEDLDRRIAEARGLSLSSLGEGFDAARGSYADASTMFQPYADTGLKAFGQYADATGVNGQAGYDRSVGTFRASPGHEWAVDQATDAVARKASSIGALGSGNTMAAISDRAGHMADQEYDQYLGRLKGIGDIGYNATGQQAGLTKGIGDLYMQQGVGEAGVYSDAARLGVSSKANTINGMAGALHGGMMAGQEAAATRLNFGLNALGTGIGLMGLGTGGGGTIGGSLFKRAFA